MINVNHDSESLAEKYDKVSKFLCQKAFLIEKLEKKTGIYE
jgi:hypothetical protein